MSEIKINNLTGFTSPQNYVLDESLRKTVELAIALNKPLLVTGAPGTGKTQLAHKIADELATSKDTSGFKFLQKPWIFNTKTTSAAKDLFYQYDAIGHFQRKGAGDKEVSVSDYIQLNALGAAIVQTRMGLNMDNPTSTNDDIKEHNLESVISEDKEKILSRISRKKLAGTPMSSVVLIDEIDKAPRDFPNDLLNEIENYQFYLSELDLTIKAAPPTNARIVIIMTSNFEKNLPPAFLRRCLFYHIPTPKGDALLKIVVARMHEFLQGQTLKLDEQQIKQRYASIVSVFDKWGTTLNDKAPATAELLEWLKALELYNFFDQNVAFDKLSDDQKKILHYTFPILAKSKDDLDVLENIMK